MKRLLGLLLIIRALTPILAVLVVIWGISRIGADFQAALEQPINHLEDELNELSVTFEAAQQQFEAARQDIDDVLARLRAFQVPPLLPNLPQSITFPSITTPNPSVSVPTAIEVQWSRVDLGFARPRYPSGITINNQNVTLAVPDIPSFSTSFPAFFTNLRNGLNNLFSGFFGIFNVFDDTLSALNELGESLSRLPDSFNGVVSEGQQLVSGLQALLAKWSGLLTAALLLILALIVISFGVTFLELFRRGLRLLFGSSA